MSAVELMSGAKSRKWVHQKPTNQPTNQPTGDHQSRILINLFEKCTDIQIDEIKFKEIIHKIMP